MSAWMVAVPLLIHGAIGVQVVSLRSELDEWPTPRLEDAVARALERTSRDKWAEHYLTVGEDARGDVGLKLVVALLDGGPKVRFTWKIETLNCPSLSDALGFDFNSSTFTDAGLDAMMRALTRRAGRLMERAREKRVDACIDPIDSPSPEEVELRRARAAAIANGRYPPVTPQPAPKPLPSLPTPPPPVPRPFVPGPSIPVRSVR
ncbi:MAG: hypothetical protein INH41_05245 [Myxococcaceae bacterium]|jgi:hypothetical protein|nr:hypothetical protein [Myxococcaceae bacterium]MCA3011790.1 hypothetical protein [Myxococcaceae bacterium]